MPLAGETLAVKSYQRFLGGKGANQSIAIAKSGGSVIHVGAVGTDGDWAMARLRDAGVDPGHTLRIEEPTGHAVITVDNAGENQILICGGANQQLTLDQIIRELDGVPAEGNWVLLQNETNLAGEIVAQARARGFKIAYSAAPFVAADALPLIDSIDLLAVNQGEAEALAEASGTAVADIPCPAVLITKGRQGALFRADGQTVEQAAFNVKAVDTTGAGDTFLGAFMAKFSQDGRAETALAYAAAASALQVTRPGASDAIPDQHEVLMFTKERGL